MNLFNRSRGGGLHLGSDGLWVAGWPLQPNADTRRRGLISEEADGRAVLTDTQIQAAVMIKIGQSGAALLAVDPDAACRRRHRMEVSAAVTEQAQASSRVI